ncbi:MAG: hypothetical protein NVS4B9_38830 [Ktedonobacteraceae bacterium]
MKKIKFPGNIKPLTEEQVLQIMQTHTTYRDIKTEQREHIQDVPSTGSVFDTAMQEWRMRPLMSDREFLDALTALYVDLEFPLVTTDKVAAIYNLRQRWEDIPPQRDGTYHVYKATSVRLQVKAARQRIERGKTGKMHLLLPLTDEEEIAVWGQTSPRTNWFRLVDALLHPLGRWSNERKTEERAKLAQGRPRKVRATDNEAEQLRKQIEQLQAQLKETAEAVQV